MFRERDGEGEFSQMGSGSGGLDPTRSPAPAVPQGTIPKPESDAPTPSNHDRGRAVNSFRGHRPR